MVMETILIEGYNVLTEGNVTRHLSYYLDKVFHTLEGENNHFHYQPGPVFTVKERYTEKVCGTCEGSGECCWEKGSTYYKDHAGYHDMNGAVCITCKGYGDVGYNALVVDLVAYDEDEYRRQCMASVKRLSWPTVAF